MEGAGEEKDSLSPGETHAMSTQPLEVPGGVYGTQAMNDTALWEAESPLATQPER